MTAAGAGAAAVGTAYGRHLFNVVPITIPVKISACPLYVPLARRGSAHRVCGDNVLFVAGFHSTHRTCWYRPTMLSSNHRIYTQFSRTHKLFVQMCWPFEERYAYRCLINYTVPIQIAQ